MNFKIGDFDVSVFGTTEVTQFAQEGQYKPEFYINYHLIDDHEASEDKNIPIQQAFMLLDILGFCSWKNFNKKSSLKEAKGSEDKCKRRLKLSYFSFSLNAEVSVKYSKDLQHKEFCIRVVIKEIMGMEMITSLFKEVEEGHWFEHLCLNYSQTTPADIQMARNHFLQIVRVHREKYNIIPSEYKKALKFIRAKYMSEKKISDRIDELKIYEKQLLECILYYAECVKNRTGYFDAKRGWDKECDFNYVDLFGDGYTRLCFGQGKAEKRKELIDFTRNLSFDSDGSERACYTIKFHPSDKDLDVLIDTCKKSLSTWDDKNIDIPDEYLDAYNDFEPDYYTFYSELPGFIHGIITDSGLEALMKRDYEFWNNHKGPINEFKMSPNHNGLKPYNIVCDKITETFNQLWLNGNEDDLMGISQQIINCMLKNNGHM